MRQIRTRTLETLVAEDWEVLEAQGASETVFFTAAPVFPVRAPSGSAMRILDVGCNTGRGGVVLRQAKPSAHIEVLEMLARGAALVPAGVYDAVTVGDLATIAGSGTQFDALVMGELIAHVPYPALEDFISSVARVLSQGGRLLLTTPNPHYLLLRWRGGSVLGGAHVSVHCPAGLTELLNHRGFRVVRLEGTGRMSPAIGVRFPLGMYGSLMPIAERRISDSRGRCSRVMRMRTAGQSVWRLRLLSLSAVLASDIPA